MFESINQGIFSFIIFVLTLLSLFSFGADSKAPLHLYTNLQQSASQNGYADVAAAAELLREYRLGLESCRSDDGYASSEEFGKFLDQFVLTVNGYMNTGGLWRRSFREEIENYVLNATALSRTYLKTKARRFDGGAEKMPATDQDLFKLTLAMHRRLASLLQVSLSSSITADAKWEKADLSRYKSDSRWKYAISAIEKVASLDKKGCEIRN